MELLATRVASARISVTASMRPSRPKATAKKGNYELWVAMITTCGSENGTHNRTHNRTHGPLCPLRG